MLRYLIFILLFCNIYTQTTGKVSGVIYDSNKSPIIGATVAVQDLGIGTVSDVNGFYYILNISPGKYTLKINMIGFNPVIVEDVIVSVNKTTKIDIDMEAVFLEGEEVVVTASKISTKQDQSGTIKNISEERIAVLPVKDVASIVTMQAGIVDGHFRGGRSTEVTYLVDGIRTDDSYGGESQTAFLEPSVLKDLEVITGTFNAEYGRAMSGVVNQVTKDGSSNFEGSISTRYENYESSHDKIFIGIDEYSVNLNQDYNIQMSGPIFKDKITFFLNYRYQDNLGHLNGLDFFNVNNSSNFGTDDSTKYYSEHSGSHVIETYCSNSQGGEIYLPNTGEHITDSNECAQYGDCEIILGGCYDEYGQFLSLSNGSECDIGFLQTTSSLIFSVNQGLITEDVCLEDFSLNNQNFITTRFIPAQIRTQNDSFVSMNNSISSSMLGKITFKPSPTFKISVMNSINDYSGQWYEHRYKYSPDSRLVSNSTNNFSSIFINYMFAKSAFIDIKYSINQKDDFLYTYKDFFDSRYLDEIYSSSTSGFIQGGQNKTYNTKSFKDINFKIDLNWQVNAIHNLKMGADKFIHELSVRDYLIRPNPDNDVYEPYIFEGQRSAYTDEFNVECFEYSAYIQDKMEFNEMVLNFGLRYDMFDPNTFYPSQYQNPHNDIINVEQSEYLKTKTKYQISPRFALSYKIYGALLRFSYGHFFQMPPLYAMFSNVNKPIVEDYAVILGNPNVEAEKTVNYELGYWQEINSNMSYELVLYNKDIYNLLSTKTIEDFDGDKFGLYTNKDYGNARGLELMFDFQKKKLNVNVNYTFQYTKGIADSPTSSFNKEGDSDPITSLIPLAWDQRHTFNVTFGYNTDIYGATISAYYNSGTAFTFTPISENPLANINLLPNNAYKPSNYTVNVSSYFNLFSKSKTFKMRMTLEIYNLLDTLNEFNVNSRTGRAYSNILSSGEISTFRNNYTTIEDTYQDPSQYGAPRSVKIGLELKY